VVVDGGPVHEVKFALPGQNLLFVLILMLHHVLGGACTGALLAHEVHILLVLHQEDLVAGGHVDDVEDGPELVGVTDLEDASTFDQVGLL